MPPPTALSQPVREMEPAQPQWMTAPLAHSARTGSGAHLELPTATSHWPIPKLSCKHSRTLGSTLHSHNSLCILTIHFAFSQFTLHSHLLLTIDAICISFYHSISEWLNPLLPLPPLPFPPRTHCSSRRQSIKKDLE